LNQDDIVIASGRATLCLLCHSDFAKMAFAGSENEKGQVTLPFL
jgi:hypothetical protein